MKKERMIRGIVVIIGTLLLGVGIGFLRLGCFGSDHYTSMNAGVSSLLSMPLGRYQFLENAVLIVIMLFISKELLGFGTIFNMIFVGYSGDFTIWILKKPLQAVFGTAEGSELPIGVRIVFFLIGFLMFCCFIAAYMAADLGIAAYDALGIILEKASKEKIPFKIARIIIDCIAVVIAVATGLSQGIQWQIVGIGTICIACLAGPLIGASREWVAKKINEMANE